VAGHDLRVAIVAATTGLSVREAKRKVNGANGNVRAAITEAASRK
jgi:N-acetylmuramic acid 6-phosphate (MurNAc-6-P) etherase